MLSLLRIRNYAIIDELQLELDAGFTVMTGETGAGKSILVDAVGLALGDRAEAGAVRSGASRAEISLVFELSRAHPAHDWLVERGLEDDEHCCLRRSVSAEGRSRAFVNNQPVSLKDLRSLGSLLVDIHGQHEHQSLLRPRAQRELLDSVADNEALRRSVAEAYADWQHAARELARRSEASADRDAELDLLSYQLGELKALGLAEGEYETLLADSERLQHVDELRQAVGGAAECLYASEALSAYSLANQARRMLEAASVRDASLAELHERLTSAEIEIKEIGGELLHRLEAIEADPARLEEIESRLSRVQQLARRHRVEEAEVHRLGDQLAARIESLDASERSIDSLTRQRDTAHSRYQELARALSESRCKAAEPLAASVTDKLNELGLPGAKFRIAITSKPEGREDSTGLDLIEFQVTANPGVPLGALDRIASGGELSRIGLALAVVANDPSSIPTLIFDEVDAGIGGAVAEVVGRRLREISARHQVLCVTHLPQVASQGARHFRIAKLTDGQVSRTQVRELDDEQRVDELSRMLGGIEITPATRAHAAEMIERSKAG